MLILSGSAHPAKEWQHRPSSVPIVDKGSNGRSKTVDSNWAVRIQQRRESEDGGNDEDKGAAGASGGMGDSGQVQTAL